MTFKRWRDDKKGRELQSDEEIIREKQALEDLEN